MRKNTAASLFVLFLVILIVSCDFTSPFLEQSDSRKNEKIAQSEIIIDMGSLPLLIDPHEAVGIPEFSIIMNIFEGLVSYDPETAQAIPALAESWETSADGLTWTFSLREAYWTDDSRITAQQVVDSYLRLMNPENGFPYSWYLNLIEGAEEYWSEGYPQDIVQVEAIDHSTVRIKTKEPAPYFPTILAHPVCSVVPTHTIKQYGDFWTDDKNLVTNGPFSIHKWKPGLQADLKQSTNYWDRENVFLKKVSYYASAQTNSYTKYIQGKTDWLTYIPDEQYEVAENHPNFQKNAILATYYLIINVSKPPFDDPRIRKALLLSIDRQHIVDSLMQGQVIPAYDLVPPMSNYPSRNFISEDIQEAKVLLAEAGYPNGEGLLKDEYDYLYNDHPGHQALAQLISQQWKDNLGIDIKLEPMSWPDYIDEQFSHNFYICRSGWFGDYPDPSTFLELFLADEGMNSGNYSSDEYDALIQSAAYSTDRYELLREAEELLVADDAAVIPIFFYSTSQMIDTKTWGGWYQNVMDVHPLKGVYKK